MLPTLVNTLLSQAAWFGIVLLGARASDGPALVVLAVTVAIHVWFTARPWRLLGLVAAAMAAGFLLDTWLLRTGLVSYPQYAGAPRCAPLFIVALWGNLATMLPHSLRWLAPRAPLAIAVGLAGTVLAYLAGERLGALTVAAPAPLSLLAIGCAYAALLALLLLLVPPPLPAPAGVRP